MIGAKVTKVLMRFVPVDGRVQQLISAGADVVASQTEADPNTSAAERVAIAAS